MLGTKWRSRAAHRLGVGALIFLANTAQAQGLASSRYSIAESDIAKVLNAVGVNVDMSQVHLPVHMSAAVAGPKLEIVTANQLGGNQVRLELRCQATSDCLPFLATLDVSDPASVVVSLRSQTAPTSSADNPTTLQIVAAASRRPQLKVGCRALMEIRDGRLDIHLPVVAMDTAAIGQQVRVCTLDRKKMFRATVTGEATVTGVME